jgi:hypothetical protein
MEEPLWASGLKELAKLRGELLRTLLRRQSELVGEGFGVHATPAEAGGSHGGAAGGAVAGAASHRGVGTEAERAGEELSTCSGTSVWPTCILCPFVTAYVAEAP